MTCLTEQKASYSLENYLYCLLLCYRYGQTWISEGYSLSQHANARTFKIPQTQSWGRKLILSIVITTPLYLNSHQK